MAKSTGKKRKRAESLLTEKADVVPESKPALDNELKKKKKKKKKKKADCPEIKMDISPAGNKNQESETVTPLESLKSGEYNNRTNREIFKGQLNKTGIFYVKGKLFDGLLEKLSRAIESTKQLEGHVHDNIWKKQKFSIGINEVTRTLERMPVAFDKANLHDVSNNKQLIVDPEDLEPFPTSKHNNLEDEGPHNQSIKRSGEIGKQVVQLQAVLAASDCHPRVLVSHLLGLASSRGIPLIFVEDHGKSSLRLGQLLKLRKAAAIGIKVGECPINRTLEEIIEDQSARLHTKMTVEPNDT